MHGEIGRRKVFIGQLYAVLDSNQQQGFHSLIAGYFADLKQRLDHFSRRLAVMYVEDSYQLLKLSIRIDVVFWEDKILVLQVRRKSPQKSRQSAWFDRSEDSRVGKAGKCETRHVGPWFKMRLIEMRP